MTSPADFRYQSLQHIHGVLELLVIDPPYKNYDVDGDQIVKRIEEIDPFFAAYKSVIRYGEDAYTIRNMSPKERELFQSSRYLYRLLSRTFRPGWAEDGVGRD